MRALCGLLFLVFCCGILASCIDTSLDMTVAADGEAPDAADARGAFDAADREAVCQDGCDDGDPCTVGDSCAAGQCVPGTEPADCDDGNPCTSDTCEVGTGCEHAAQDGACEDQDACTVGDHCSEGECAAGQTPLGCEDDNPCTADACDALAGCVFSPLGEGTCDDGDKCTVGDSCGQGACTGQPANVAEMCDDENYCTKDTCDAGLGCQHEALQGSPCEDGLKCTLNDFCEAGICRSGKDWFAGDPDCPYPTCGDAKCLSFADYVENPAACAVDCGPCGDGVCSAAENKPNKEGASCPPDCACQKDCGFACGNGECEAGEFDGGCVLDCGICGDQLCSLNETAQKCPADCPSACGDETCLPPEHPSDCPLDCGSPCPDGACEEFESLESCPEDCGWCGDEICTTFEQESDTCKPDCVTPCGNKVCEGGETADQCKVDCGSCGDGVCGAGETFDSCPDDCLLNCGNGKCGANENATNCPEDCGCTPACEGRECGPDGCGGEGVCGICLPGESCVEGKCV